MLTKVLVLNFVEVLSWISKYFKCVVHVKIDVSVDWSVGAGIGRFFGSGVGRDIVYEVESDVGVEGGEGSEL